MTISDHKFDMQVRFNWGYHDGVADERASRKPMFEANGVTAETHPDQVWLRGYLAGRTDVRNGRSTETSTEAWEYYGPNACPASPVYRSADSKAPASGHRFSMQDYRGLFCCEYCLVSK